MPGNPLFCLIGWVAFAAGMIALFLAGTAQTIDFGIVGCAGWLVIFGGMLAAHNT